jgi:hypothetical protein
LASKVIFQADFQADLQAHFQAPVGGESAATILPPAPQARRARQLQAQRFRLDLHGRHEPSERVESGSPPFTCRDFVKTREHFVYQ